MQYILTEKEYLELNEFKERFDNAQSWINHKNGIIDDLDAKTESLTKQVERLQNENKTLRESNSKTRSYNNQLQELLKVAYMETFRVRTNLQSDIEDLQKQIEEMKRDMQGTEKALADARQDLCAEQNLREGVQEELQHCQKISAMRLETMNHLVQECHNLKHRDCVCIATNPGTGTTKVVSAVKADTYRKFGWAVSEEYLVDRPA